MTHLGCGDDRRLSCASLRIEPKRLPLHTQNISLFGSFNVAAYAGQGAIDE